MISARRSLPRLTSISSARQRQAPKTTAPPDGGAAAFTVAVRRLRGLRRRAEILAEEIQRALPGKVSGRLVVARRAEVVVEGVLGAWIDVLGVLLVVGLQRLLIGG